MSPCLVLKRVGGGVNLAFLNVNNFWHCAFRVALYYIILYYTEASTQCTNDQAHFIKEIILQCAADMDIHDDNILLHLVTIT